MKKNYPHIIQFDQLLQSQLMVIFFIIIGIISRILPHPANFTPIGAIALFAGTKIKYRWALIIPIATMLISDYFIGFHNLMIYVYACLIFTVAIGVWLKKHYSPAIIIISALGSSLLFFLITNFGVWLQTGMYEPNLAGLMRCYMMAIPFFRNSIAGDLFYTVSIFGAYELVSFFIKKFNPNYHLPTTNRRRKCA